MASSSDPDMGSVMTARMRDQHRAISALARSDVLKSGELNLSLMEITEVAAKTLNVGRSSIWLYNKEKSKIVCQDLYRIEEGHGLHEQSLELHASDYPAYFAAISEARTIAAHDAHSHDATKEFSVGYLAPLGIQSMLDAPIFVSGQMVGVVCQEHIGRPRHWELDEENFVGSIADMVAMALESSNRRLAQEQLEIRIGQIAALVDVSRSVISVLDIDSLLIQVIDTIGLVMNAEASSLLLIEEGPEGRQLRFRFSRGSASADLYHDTIQMGQGFAGWVALNGVPLIVDDAYTDSRFNPRFDKKTGFRTRSVITVPLLCNNNKVLGVIQAVNKKSASSFDQDDLELFQTFASMVSVSLENAQLVADLRKSLEQERRLAIEKEKLGAFLPKVVVDEVSRSRETKLALGGKVVEATVLFSDIKGFTSLSELMKPEDVVAFLNDYMTVMSDIIDSEGGLVDKFIGDGIMAIFLSSASDVDHALRAVRAAISMQDAVGGAKEKWCAMHPCIVDLEVRVGINSGEMVAGNIGSQSRMEYTVIGDNVNVASRIESNGKEGRVMISESTYHRIKDYGINATKLEAINVKNRRQPVQIYCVEGFR
jgi:class 3 adenylate cyclase